MNRFVIAGAMDAEAEKNLVAYFREVGLGWWHRVPNFWLITDRPGGRVTATAIRDKIRELRKGSGVVLVMEIAEDVTWAGLHPSSKQDTFDWLKTTWKGD